MSRVLLLLGYKIKMFFGPSYRGRLGPLPLILLAILFIPTGLGIGYATGVYVADTSAELGIATIGSMVGFAMVFGLVFALGVGVTAHASELDFLMTTPVRPREYLISDMLFEFSSLTIGGGLAIIFAAVGFLWGVEKPIWYVVPLLLVAGLFAMFVFMIVQIVTVLKITHPKARVRTAVLVLMALCLIPVGAFANPSWAESIADLPIPQSAFASLAHDLMFETTVSLTNVVVLAVYLLAVVALWFRLSDSYFFHGVRPTLSAGFGQIDMGAKMAQQRKLIGFFGKSTGTIYLKVGTGSDLSLMTRLNLIRMWRDGSFFFLCLLAAVFIVPGVMGGEERTSGMAINMVQAAGWPIAIVALNWCYYERENLWIPVVGGKSVVTYFRGLMLSLMILGLGIATVMLGFVSAAGLALKVPDVAFMVTSVLGDSVVASLLLTRVRVKPGAFSPGLIVVLFATFTVGGMLGFAGSLVVGMIPSSTLLSVVVQWLAVLLLVGTVVCVGFLGLDRLAKGFQFS